jgi:isopenicillin N synthase-like dioxygenase
MSPAPSFAFVFAAHYSFQNLHHSRPASALDCRRALRHTEANRRSYQRAQQLSSSKMNAQLTAIPNIDISPFLAGSANGRAQVVADVKKACEQVGFFMISGHGVANDLIRHIRNVSYQFFDLPIEQKSKSACDPKIVGASGFEVMGKTALARTIGKSTPPDYREAYKITSVDVKEDDPYYQSEYAAKFFPPTIWPEQPADFRSTYEEYYRAMQRLSIYIMRIFALALDLDEHFFDDKIDKAVNRLNAVMYPAQTELPADGQLRAGEHTDYGTLTILLAEDKPGGLQVRLRSGDWVNVCPPEGAFVINIGDMMMHWTNDHWISNLHRVANPPREFADVPRLSIVFFQKPNYNAEIKCIEAYAGEATTAKYQPMTAGEHWYAKNEKARPAEKTK